MKIINSYKKLSQSNTNLAKKLTRNKNSKYTKMSMSNSKISLICCMDKNGGFGKDNHLPWSLPTDYKFYLKMAEESVRICGKNTYQETFSPKDDFYEHSVVVSRSLAKEQQLQEKENDMNSCGESDESDSDASVNSVNSTCSFVENLSDSISIAKSQANSKPIFFTGGKRIFEEALDKKFADYAFITKVDGNFECDTFIDTNLLKENYVEVIDPSLELLGQNNELSLCFLEHYKKNPHFENGISFSFHLYKKK